MSVPAASGSSSPPVAAAPSVAPAAASPVDPAAAAPPVAPAAAALPLLASYSRPILLLLRCCLPRTLHQKQACWFDVV